MLGALLALALAASATPNADPCQTPGLASWLCKATFTLPPLPPIPVSGGAFKVTVQIDHLACSGIKVNDLSSSVATAGKVPNFGLTLSGASLSCTTKKVSVQIDGHGLVSAAFDLGVDGATLGLLLAVPRANMSQAALTLPKLDLGKLEPKIHLSPPWGKLLDGLIDEALKLFLPGLIKSELPTLVATLSTGLLDPLLGGLQEWVGNHFPPAPLPEPTLPPPQAQHTQLVAWDDPANPIRALTFLLDEVVGADGPAGLNGLAKLLTGGSGNVTISNETMSQIVDPLLPTLSLVIGNLSLANLTLIPRTAQLSGLASMDKFAALSPPPHAHQSLDFLIGWSGLSLTLDATIVATPLPGGLVSGAGTLTEDFRIVVDLSALDVRLTTLLALNQTFLDRLSAEEVLSSPRCAIKNALPFNASSLGVRAFELNMTLSQLRVLAQTSLTLENC